MQKNTIAIAAMAACFSSGIALAQSKVELYGVVDTAIRHTTNEGAQRGSKTQMVGGGMSQSRWGINVTEDLGGGTKALVNLENRFVADTGDVAPNSPYFSQAWIGLQGKFGRLSMGRQFNPMFDLVTSTYASFPYSPYMDAYKPEVGLAMGARANNSIKYAIAVGSFSGSLFYSFDEGNNLKDSTSVSGTGGIKSKGGFLRYSDSGLSIGAGMLSVKLPAGSKLDGWTLGGSYRKDKLYFNLGYGQNKLKAATSAPTSAQYVDAALVNGWWGTGANGGFSPTSSFVNGTTTVYSLSDSATKRTMYKAGIGYQITPKVNLGIHYYRARQTGSIQAAYNGRANFIVAAANYAFSKRTDAYFAVDNTKISGGSSIVLDAQSNARSRNGFTVGLRHRF